MTKLDFKISLGDKVKDKVTGYEGTVVACTQWLNGCNRYQIQGPLDKDGKIPEVVGFDEENLVVVEKKAVAHKTPDTGGDAPIVSRARDPRRNR